VARDIAVVGLGLNGLLAAGLGIASGDGFLLRRREEQREVRVEEEMGERAR
jgi:hypothetical protein